MINFNPRTPVGCDSSVRYQMVPRRISIHAPQWGATKPTTPPTSRVPYFNPRTPVGCDYNAFNMQQYTVGISIHAPQWGATILARTYRRARVFQSTHPSGVRRDYAVRLVLGVLISIHAPQWGATIPVVNIGYAPRNFNPRTPVGCDKSQGHFQAYVDISIHAPQWGATGSNGTGYPPP